MRILAGLLGVAALLVYVLRSNHEGGFTGAFHLPSLILVGGAPLFMALISYNLDELLQSGRALVEAIRFRPTRSRQELYEALTRFSTEVRAGRPAAALELAEGSNHSLFQQLAPLVIRRYDVEAIERTASTALFVESSRLRRAEELFTTLSRAAPAAGLLGTVLGLIALLRDLSSFEKLGPSMALALLCTFYGLLFANALYQPLARLVRAYMTAFGEEARLLTRALALAVEGKPLADVRALFGPEQPQAPIVPTGVPYGG